MKKLMLAALAVLALAGCVQQDHVKAAGIVSCATLGGLVGHAIGDGGGHAIATAVGAVSGGLLCADAVQ